MRAGSLIRILRPALAPTAAADVLAGAAFAGAWDLERLPFAVAASILLYTGGMAQNDLCDRRRDVELAPDRPLVVHPELLNPVRLLVAGLFAAGLACGALAGLFWHALAVAGLATAYNLGLKRIFPADIAAMGGARGANLAMGLAAGGYGATGAGMVYVAGYVIYIASVTAASRAEEMEPPPTRTLAQMLSFLPQLAVYLVLAVVLADRWVRAAAFLIPAALHAAALTGAMRAGTRPAAERYVFRSLLLIYLFHACVLWGVGESGALIAVLSCAAATFFLLGALAKREDGRRGAEAQRKPPS